jgi:phage protein D
MLGRLLRNIANSVKRVFGIEEPDVTTAETIDTPDINPGEKIDVNGVGGRFSGESNVDSVSHNTDKEGYETGFDADRSKGLSNDE